MDFSHFDARHYPTLSVQEGYTEWAATYENVVQDTMDLRLLERLQAVPWTHLQQGADLACGTGRIGVWLRQRGVPALDGVDLTTAMLEVARTKNVYRQLYQGDILDTPLATESYDLTTAVLVDEHLPDVRPFYQEAARITRPNGYFVLVGYHPFFLMGGIPTHFNNTAGEPVTIQCYVHLLNDHVQAALAAGWTLQEMREGVIDNAWLARKPKWSQYKNRPVSFALVWQKPK